MKFKVLTRNPNDYLRETKRDIHKIQRNYDPALHPMETAREYKRALNATKLERLFAKPYIGCLDGHSDGVSTIAKHPTRLSVIASGAYDGQVCVWNLATKASTSKFNAHVGCAEGLAFNNTGDRLYSVGKDYAIKTWDYQTEENDVPVKTVTSETSLNGICHHQADDLFATYGSSIQIWDSSRSDPTRSYEVDNTVLSGSFNPIETYLMGCTSYDRNILFYDVRGSQDVRRVQLRMISNKLAWNPMEAYIFTVANEDHNLYTFDMRAMKRPIKKHFNHTAAVMDVDYSPTGKEFASASYDKTIRIYNASDARSRDIYHTKRMQKLKCIRWTADNKYILSGSSEMNIRIWKANASEKLGTLKHREVEAFTYNEKLKEKFSQHPEIRRIAKHRHVPKSIRFHSAQEREQLEKIKRKSERVLAHSGKKFGPEKIVEEQE